jgi:hypothetical protein
MYQASSPLFAPKDPTQELAKLLMSQGQRKKIETVGEGIASAVGDIGNALMMSKRLKMDKAERASDSRNLLTALQIGKGFEAGTDKNGINWSNSLPGDKNAMAEILMQNERTQPVAERMLLGDMDREQDLQAKIAEAKALMPYEIQLARAKYAASGGGESPAPVKIANQITQYLNAAKNAKTPQEKQQYIFQANLLAQSAKMYEKNTTAFGAGGDMSLNALPGYNDFVTSKSAADETGKKEVDLVMNPQIAGAEKAAELNAVREGQKTDADLIDAQTLPIIDSLKGLNEKTFNAPYLETIQPAAKVTGIGKEQATATDLMRQARLDMAAPLAKQLGVNPTDRDFQATLDRIFDINASKDSRAAQINALEARIKAKAAARRGMQPQTAAPSAPKPRLKYNPTTGEFE